MDNKADIRFIYTHAKGNSSYNDLNLVAHEILLDTLSHLTVKACMVGLRSKPLLLQKARYILCAIL